MRQFHHILVPVDFSESSLKALDLAVQMAETYSSALTLLHVWEVPVYPYGLPIAVDYLTPIEEAAKAKLAELVAETKTRFPAVQSLLGKGVAWQEIITTATQLPADLVVMGTHGRRGLDHLLLGSVAEKVVRRSPCPVLTVRPHATEAHHAHI